jgi:hypothetical protein
LGQKEWSRLLSEVRESQSIELYNIMKEQGISPTLEIFHGLIRAHSRKGQIGITKNHPPKVFSFF